MVVLRCVVLRNGIDDDNICRAYAVDGGLHVVGGIVSGGWQRRNRVPLPDCAKCGRFGRNIFTGRKIPG